MKLGLKTKKSSIGACAPENAFSQIIGQSSELLDQLKWPTNYAASEFPVRIDGETGTGKDLIAQGIYKSSRRADRPFVAFNCAGSTLELFEDKVFGHVPGAFTGAVSRRQGLVEMTDTGTLFLDEISALPHAAQSMLLRFLETGDHRKVGEDAVRHANVRIICATNKDLSRMVDSGTFFEDLFYRLDALSLTLPPLRQRVEDIPLLAAHFIRHTVRTQLRRQPRFVQLPTAPQLTPWPVWLQVQNPYYLPAEQPVHVDNDEHCRNIHQ